MWGVLIFADQSPGLMAGPDVAEYYAVISVTSRSSEPGQACRAETVSGQSPHISWSNVYNITISDSSL